MKYISPILLFAFLLLTACGDNGNNTLSTDLVTNPKSAEKSGAKEAVIAFDKTEHDFGKLLQGEVVTYTFHYTNTGTAPLLVTGVNTSCGCTASEFSKEPIEPGKSGTIKATYNSKGHTGFQNKTLSVMSNTNPSVTVLRIKAEVRTADQF